MVAQASTPPFRSKADMATRNEERTPVVLAQGAGTEVILELDSVDSLPWDPADWFLQIQITDAAALTWQVEVEGPGAVFVPLDGVDRVNNDTVQVRFRFPKVKIVFSGVGASNVHVIGRKA